MEGCAEDSMLDSCGYYTIIGHTHRGDFFYMIIISFNHVILNFDDFFLNLIYIKDVVFLTCTIKLKDHFFQISP